MSWTAASLPWQRALHTDAAERRVTANRRPRPSAYQRWVDSFGEKGVHAAATALGFDVDGLRGSVESTVDPDADAPLPWVGRADRHLALGRAAAAPEETFLLGYGDSGLLRPATDLARGYQRALHTSTSRTVRGRDPRLRGLPELLASALPLAEIDQVMARTMVLEMNVARVRGQLAGDSPEERHADYLRRLGDDRTQRALWSEYTVLLRKVDQLLAGWLASRLEFAERIVEDLDDLEILHGASLGDVTSVDFGAGDTHRGGRSVAIVGFSGPRLVYKPRPLSSDEAWNRVIDWFNGQSPDHALLTPRVLTRPRHGWAEFIEHLPCRAGEGDAFYWRLGALLTLNYALCGTDVHYENIIASGAHPVMIDMEALFHGGSPDNADEEYTDPASKVLREGVVRVGLLPSKVTLSGDGGVRMIDTGAISANRDQESLFPVPTLRNRGTDEMAFGAEHGETRVSTAHRPHTNGTPLEPRDHVEAVMSGFVFAYRRVLADREAWLSQNGLLDGFHDAELRYIARPTFFYAALLADSAHPDFLRDGREQDRLLARLASGAEGTHSWERLVRAELAELRIGDIPYFSFRPGSTDLTSGQDTTVPGFLGEPPAEVVRRQLLRMGEDDLRTQTTLILKTFDSLRPVHGTASHRSPVPCGEALTETMALEGALRIAHELCDEAVEDGDTLGWIGLQLVDERLWQLGPALTDLYSGLPGIGLFLSRTGLLTGDERVHRYAENTAGTVAERVRYLVGEYHRLASDTSEEQAVGPRPDPGVFSGVGGAIYYLAHAGFLHERGDWLDAAESCLPVLRAHITHDVSYDMIAGSAGALLAALSLHRVRPHSDALATAEHAASVLLERAKTVDGGLGWINRFAGMPISGMSHGNAGMAHALLRLHGVGANTRDDYLAAARQALHHERSLFDPALGNWPREWPPGTRNTLTWCYGAPGIGLARVAALSIPGTEPLRPMLQEDMETAERITHAAHFSGAEGFTSLGHHGLCHGDLGNLEFLAMAARHREDSDALRTVLSAAGALYTRSRKRGWETAPVNAASCPGFMHGRAGIGYNLLRLAAPDRTPSVLLLETP